MPGSSDLLADVIATFLRVGEATNHSPQTRRTYAGELNRFARDRGLQTLAELTAEAVQDHLAAARGRVKPVSLHKVFRTLRSFCRWCVRTGRLSADPMADLKMRAPKTLPRVPERADVEALLDACHTKHEGRRILTNEGRRNRALIALAAGSGLRKEELRRLRIGDIDLATRQIRVRAGKGQKDGLAHFDETTASLVRVWLAVHPDPRPAAFLCCTTQGVQLGPSAITRIFHRLSRRAGLTQKIGPHALRHYAATEVWRRSGDLELVRQVLRHETLTMALRYVAVSQADVAAKFAAVSPMDHLRIAGISRTGEMRVPIGMR